MTGSSTVPFFDLGAVNCRMRDDLIAAFDRVVSTSDYCIGAEVESFEEALATMTGASEAVGVNSGTAALHLTLLGAGIGTGDEVILPPSTFFATAEAVVAAGATPVFADVDPATALLDADAVEDAITIHTAAIIAVHLYGQPVDAERFRGIARRHGLFLLEDAAQALGGSWGKQPVGSLGDAAAHSFYPTKTIGALGQGGAVTTNDARLAERVRRLRCHGEGPKNVHHSWGWNERLDGVQAAMLNAKLAYARADLADRRAAVALYESLLCKARGVTLLRTHPEAGHAHHLFTVRVAHRDAVREVMARRGVETGTHYPTPVHLQPAADGLAEPGSLPHAEHHAMHTLSLPLFPGITAAQVEQACATLVDAIEEVETNAKAALALAMEGDER